MKNVILYAGLSLLIGASMPACNKEIKQQPATTTTTPDAYRETDPAPPAAQGASATNVILLIGDGMGLTQVSSAYYFMDDTPSFSRFQDIGLHINYATDAKITDSASGATAFSTGHKTYNAAIGVDTNKAALPTILEIVEAEGLKTGLVATSSIVHATPASFYAHVDDRNKYEEIAAQLVTSD
ncbi:MAG: alkaline phosphatase, partial [Lewinella sp.]|nr:alkaline phosphatase [Lewinella sp.]